MLSSDEARQLDRLALGSSGVSPATAAAGLRHSRTRGYGLEFEDFRRYQPGDDPRSIDWTVEARLQQLVVRVCRAEGHVRLHLLLDVSGSMGAGTPEKLTTARKIAAALSYVAVERRDLVGIATFSDRIQTHVPLAAGRSQVFRVFDALRLATAGGASRIDRALMDYGSAVRGGGLAVVLSDFFQPTDTLEGLRYLVYRGLTPAVVQVVAPEEFQPDVPEAGGELELVDIEHPDDAPLVVDASAFARYRENMARHSADLASFCAAHGLSWLRADSSLPFEELLRAGTQAGLLSVQG